MTNKIIDILNILNNENNSNNYICQINALANYFRIQDVKEDHLEDIIKSNLYNLYEQGLISDPNALESIDGWGIKMDNIRPMVLTQDGYGILNTKA